MLDIDIGILTSLPISSRDQGAAFLQLLIEKYPGFAPECVSNTEPVNHSLSGAGVSAALDYWAEPFLWRRRRPRIDGNVWFGRDLRHTSIYLSCSSKTVDHAELLGLFREIASLVESDFAYLHLTSDVEFEAPDFDDRVLPFRRGVTTHQLCKNVPDLCWATIFGRPYEEVFGSGRIQTTPCYRVEEIVRGVWMIQITSELSDVVDQFQAFDESRAVARAHLNSGVFYDPHAEKPYRVPSFQGVTKRVQ